MVEAACGLLARVGREVIGAGSGAAADYFVNEADRGTPCEGPPVLKNAGGVAEFQYLPCPSTYASTRPLPLLEPGPECRSHRLDPFGFQRVRQINLRGEVRKARKR